MKFNLKLKTPRTRRFSKSSGSSSSKKHQIPTVESWNELRHLGSEARRPHGIESVLKNEDEELVLQEAQDWDYYIAQFNEQYKQQMKHRTEEDEMDRSISTLADSPSQLMLQRTRRMIILRKMFIICCLCLWCIAYWGANEWYIIYMIWPVGFLHDMDESPATKYFTPGNMWVAFFVNAHSWIIASWGLLVVHCFRENTNCIYQFILRCPYLVVIPLSTIMVAVRFVGTVSSNNLEKSMEKKIPEYHFVGDNAILHDTRDNDSVLSGRRLWDQTQKILQCCGVHSAKDWDSVDDDLTDDISYMPETCCPKRFHRRAWTRERPGRDDCYTKINKMFHTNEYEWAYPDGCLNEAYEFFIKIGALTVAIMFTNFCGLVVSLFVAYKYYVALMKCHEMRFKYTFGKWLAEILFLHHCGCVITGFKKLVAKCNKKPGKEKKEKDKSTKKPAKSVASGQLSIMSQESHHSIPSVILTGPGEEPDEDDIGSGKFRVLFDNRESEHSFNLDNQTVNNKKGKK